MSGAQNTSWMEKYPPSPLRKQASSRSLKNSTGTTHTPPLTPIGGRPKGQPPQTAGTSAAHPMKRATTIGSPSSKSKNNNNGTGSSSPSRRGLTVRIDDMHRPEMRQSIQSAPVRVIRRLPAAPGDAHANVPPVPPLPKFIAGSAVSTSTSAASVSVTSTSASTAPTPSLAVSARAQAQAPLTPATAPATSTFTFGLSGQIQMPRVIRPLPCPPIEVDVAVDGASHLSSSTPTPTKLQEPHTANSPTTPAPTRRVLRPLPIPKFNIPSTTTRKSIVPLNTTSLTTTISPRSPDRNNTLQNYRSSTIDIDLTPEKKGTRVSPKGALITGDLGSDSENELADADEKASLSSPVTDDIDSLYGPLLTSDESRTVSGLFFSRNEDMDGDSMYSVSPGFGSGLKKRFTVSQHHRTRYSVDSERTASSEGDEELEDSEEDFDLQEAGEGEYIIDYARVLSARVMYRQQPQNHGHSQRQQDDSDPETLSKWVLEAKEKKSGAWKRVTQRDIGDVIKVLRTL